MGDLDCESFIQASHSCCYLFLALVCPCFVTITLSQQETNSWGFLIILPRLQNIQLSFFNTGAPCVWNRTSVRKDSFVCSIEKVFLSSLLGVWVSDTNIHIYIDQSVLNEVSVTLVVFTFPSPLPGTQFRLGGPWNSDQLKKKTPMRILTHDHRVDRWMCSHNATDAPKASITLDIYGTLCKLWSRVSD